MAIDGEDNIKVANRSAKVAEDSLLHAQTTSKCELRAYILVRAVELGFDGVNKPFVQCMIANLGKTPAIEIEICSNLDIFEFKSASDTFAIPDLPPGEQPKFILQPQKNLNGPTRQAEGREFTNSEIRGAVNGTEQRLYIFGYARYFDVFGDAHETPFVSTVSGGPGLQAIFNCKKFEASETPRFEMNAFDRKLT